MTDLDRRRALELLAGATAASVSGCLGPSASGTGGERPAPARQPAGAVGVGAGGGDAEVVLGVTPLGPQWETSDPFLFCAHHDDRYPRGNERLGPDASLAGRQIGSDFAGKDGWRMYHGDVVPGFPRHPHRGFETVTVVRTGLLDHSDSLGARARYGGGDVQWMTAGRGIMHAEMFPLLDQERDNPLELFQIWLNLPASDKMVPAYFDMLWADTIPQVEHTDDSGNTIIVTSVAGEHAGKRPPAPPRNSWAARDEADVAIRTIKLAAGAQWVLPGARAGTDRSLYFFRGSGLKLAGRAIPEYHRVRVRGDAEVHLAAGDTEVELLLLQGRPIGEPVARRGPFVMNTREEIAQAYEDYRATRFGDWPWDRDDPVHDLGQGRFAQHPDGRLDTPV